MKPPFPDLDRFTEAYIEAMLWSTTDESDESGGKPLDDSFGVYDLTAEAMAKCIADCKAFQEANAGDIKEENYLRQTDYSVEAMAGYDFWMTRNGHGVGFWDGDWEEEVGERLDKSAEAFGEVYPYVTEDGEIDL